MGQPPLKLEELDSVLKKYEEWRSSYVEEEILMEFEIGGFQDFINFQYNWGLALSITVLVWYNTF